MLVQNSNSKTPARPDLANNLLQILILTTFNNLFCVKKGNLHFSHVLEDDFLVKYLIINPQKIIAENSS